MAAGDNSLERFVEAQAPIYETALAELKAGRKRSHWMWFILPQLRGLGMSPTSVFYGIAGLDEARRYLAHPLLGPRLRACVAAVVSHGGRKEAEEIFGFPDCDKFRSCLTLFRAVAEPGGGDQALLQECLEAFYRGAPDPRTEAMLHG